MSRKYFGTDGVRGTVGQSPMTPDLQALGLSSVRSVMRGPDFYLGVS